MLVLSSTPWWLPDLPWIRQSLARRIALRTGLSCEIGRLRLITADGCPRAESIRLFSSAPGGGQSEFILPAVRTRIDWSALWHRRPALAEVIIDGGEVVWQAASKAVEPEVDLPPSPSTPTLAENQPDRPAPVGLVPLAGPDERAEPPSTPTTVTPATPATPTPTPTPTPAVAAATSTVPESPDQAPAPAAAAAAAPPATAPPAAPASTPPTPTPGRWSVRHLTITNLRVRLLAPGPAARELASAQLDASLPLGAAGSGHLGVRSVVLLGDRSWTQALHLPLTSDGSFLFARAVPIECPGGRLNLSLRCETSAPGIPMIAEIGSDGLDLRGVLDWANPGLAPAEGTLAGRLQLIGFARRPRSFQSLGQVEAHRLVFPLQAWLRAAGLEALAARVAQPEMTTGSGRLLFRSVGGRVMIDDASLMTAEATLRSTGSASPGAGLNFSARAYLSAGGLDLANQLTAAWPPERRFDFTVLPNSPWTYLDSWIQGPLESPEVVLWGRAWTLPQLRAEVDRLNAPPHAPSG